MTVKRRYRLLTKLAPMGALAMMLGGQIGCGGAGGGSDPATEGASQDSTSLPQSQGARTDGAATSSTTGNSQTSTAQAASTNKATGTGSTTTSTATAPTGGSTGATPPAGSGGTTTPAAATSTGTAPAAAASAGTTAPATSTSAAAAPAAGPSAPAAAAPAAGGTGTIVPLYSAPGSGTWSAVAAAKKAHPSVPILAVINPNNGPGTAALSDYMAGIAELTGAGVKVIGYVFTSYGARAASDVQADIARWRNLYPGVSGIFFDEMVNQPGKESYYKDLTAAAKGSGFDFTIGNPGSDGGPTYVGTVDTILIYESPGLPSGAAMGGWHASHDRHNFGVIPYGISAVDPAFIAAAKPAVGYIYLQNDGMPNPWDTLPPYFDQLVAALQ